MNFIIQSVSNLEIKQHVVYLNLEELDVGATMLWVISVMEQYRIGRGHLLTKSL